MPNPSKGSASSSEAPRTAAGEIARDLYLAQGAGAAAKRCEVNSRLGDFDLAAVLLQALELAPGDVALDVGCGSGAHLLAYAARVGPAGAALGFDFSPQAVRAARGRGARAAVADAAALPVPDAFARAAASSFAIYYHPDLGASVRELARVLSPGGRVAVCGPAAGTNRELYDFHRRATGREPSDADLMALGYVEGPVGEALAGHPGFEGVEVETFTNHIVFPDAGSFLDYWLSTSLFLRTPDARPEDGRRALAGHAGAFLLTKRVALATARRRTGAGPSRA